MRIVEHAAAVIVDKGFRESALGDDDIVALKLDVEIFHLVHVIGLYDRHAVDEVLGLDQHTLDIHGVVRRYSQIAPRYIWLERSGLDADRQDVLAAKNEATRISAPSDPFDRPHRPRSGDQPLTDGQALDRAFAAIGQDRRCRGGSRGRQSDRWHRKCSDRHSAGTCRRCDRPPG